MDSGLSLALSILIGSFFLLTIMTAHSRLQELNLENFLENIAEEKLEVAKDVIKFHVEKIGYKVKSSDIPAGEEILYTASNDTFIQFYADIDGSGSVDFVELYGGSKSDLSDTENPNDFNLYLKINNGVPARVARGLTFLSFTCEKSYSETNNQVTVSVIVQTPEALKYKENGDSTFYQSQWKEIICPDNLGWY